MGKIKSYGVIYAVTNKVNGKVYIGQTTDFETRVDLYKKLRCQGQRKLYNALKKYGVDNFYYEMVDIGLDKEALDFLEDYYIKIFKSLKDNMGYNIREGGGSHGKHSPETKKKISEALTGRERPPMSEEQKNKIREKNKGQKRSDEINRKNSEGHKGIFPSEETRQKLSKAKMGNNYAKGKPFTSTHKKRLSDARKGKKHSQATIDKMKVAQTERQRKLKEIQLST